MRIYDISGTAEYGGLEVREATETLARRLHARNAKRIDVQDREIRFRGPWLTHNWHLLALVSFGKIAVEGHHERLRITWRLSLWRLRASCLLFSSVAIIMFPCLLWEHPIQMLVAVPAVLGVVWGWLYGMNWMITSIRFRNFVQKALSE